MFNFSKETENFLVQAGWYKGRNIDINLLNKVFNENGYVLPSTVESFLSEFGNLNLAFTRSDGSPDKLHFDTKKAIEDIDLLRIDAYSKRTGNPDLYVIGQAYSDHLTLMMSTNGEVFGGYDDYLCLIANSGEQAIETICSNMEVKEISPVSPDFQSRT